MVKAWIMNALSKEISKIALYYKTTKEAWDNLEEHYGVANTSKYYSIQRAITTTTLGSSNIATYFTRLKGYWDELGTCTFGKPCTCGSLLEFIEGQQLIQFLSRLNDTYSTVRSNILMVILVPSIGKAYSLLIRDEKQREIKSDAPIFSSDSASFLANSQSAPAPPQYNNPRNYTQRTGHTVHKCYKLHGFPPNFKFTKNRPPHESKVVVCAQLETSSEISMGPDTQNVDVSPHGFSKEQYAHLLYIFQQGTSLKRLLEIGKVDHGLYILHMPSTASISAPVSLDHLVTTVAPIVSAFPSVSLIVSNNDVSPSACSLHTSVDDVSSSSVFSTSYDYSRVTWTHLLSRKGNAFSLIKAFINMVSTHYGTTVQTIRTDNAFELGSYTSYVEYLSSIGVSHQTT
ncbi:uncharacterized protein [Nicotiana tomentosiformis]|uniref:uncharacterized protein n=1 Tax=Nicotiana tomentosiformis TaxID=4098 RepID=UPI00388CC968